MTDDTSKSLINSQGFLDSEVIDNSTIQAILNLNIVDKTSGNYLNYGDTDKFMAAQSSGFYKIDEDYYISFGNGEFCKLN
jgi:hypothetical protein